MSLPMFSFIFVRRLGLRGSTAAAMTSNGVDLGRRQGALPYAVQRAYKTEASKLRSGMVVEIKNRHWAVTDALVSKKGRGAAHVQCELRNVRDQRKQSVRFRSNESVEVVEMEHSRLEFIGRSDDDESTLVFENEQGVEVECDGTVLGDFVAYLTPDSGKRGSILLSELDGEVVDVRWPTQVHARIQKREDLGASKFARATLENGRVLRVPKHCKDGEWIIVKLPAEEYGGKVE